MLEATYESLSQTEKVLFQQVAANPVYQKMLELEKEAIEHQILNFYRIEKESDQEFCKRLEKIQYSHSVIKSLLSINERAINLRS